MKKLKKIIFDNFSLTQNTDPKRSQANTKKRKCICNNTNTSKQDFTINDFDIFSSNLTSPGNSASSISSSVSLSSINSDTNQENILPTFSPGHKECKCSQFDYTIENQIRIKHKQIELINENLPLTFDILDKCQTLSSTYQTGQ